MGFVFFNSRFFSGPHDVQPIATCHVSTCSCGGRLGIPWRFFVRVLNSAHCFISSDWFPYDFCVFVFPSLCIPQFQSQVCIFFFFFSSPPLVLLWRKDWWTVDVCRCSIIKIHMHCGYCVDAFSHVFWMRILMMLHQQLATKRGIFCWDFVISIQPRWIASNYLCRILKQFCTILGFSTG